MIGLSEILRNYDIRMHFRIEGRKAKPFRSYLSESDLLTLPRKNIKMRQRYINRKVLCVCSWENRDLNGSPKYSTSQVTLKCIYAN